MEGHLKKRGRKGVWYLVYDEPAPSGKRKQRWVSLKTTVKSEAARAARAILLERDRLTPEKAKPVEMTVAELFEVWLARREATLAANTHERYDALTRKHVIPVIGAMKLADVEPAHIDKVYVSMRARGLSERTCLHVHRTLHTSFGFAVRYLRAVPENVVGRVQTPRARPRENEAFSISQIQLVLEAAKDSRLEVPVLVSALTGLRRGELLALKWTNVDLDRGSIFVVEALEQTARFGVRFKEPKSRSSRRQLPIPDELVTVLQEHRLKQEHERASLGGMDLGLVFCNPDGSPWPPDTLTKQFAEMVRLIGIDGFRLHDLRHAFASVTLSNGSSVKEVSTLLGHSSAMLTLSTYARSMEGQGREAVSGLARTLLARSKESGRSVSNR